MNATAALASHRARRTAWTLALALVILCVAWELVLAPLRPGGSWLALKAVPLAVLLPGLMRGHLRTMQITTLVILLYVAEATVRLGDAAPVGTLAFLELLLACAVFVAAVAFVAPFKRAARALHDSRSRTR
jgi:uncharacterized membrane protein